MRDTIAFAHEWIDAWNSHDLERILTHYADDVVFVSPRAAALVPESGGEIRGIAALRAYWRLGLERNPDLRFTLVDVLASAQGLTMLYRNQLDQLVAETMLVNVAGRVRLGVAAYGALSSAA